MHECGGALSLVIIVLGAIAEGFVANKLIAPGDAATTAHNIMAAPALWQFSVAGDLIIVLCAVPLLWIEYLLLRPVSKQLVLLNVRPSVLSRMMNIKMKTSRKRQILIGRTPSYLASWWKMALRLLCGLGA
jgi:Domain of unknown function (DUF4386)